MALSLESPNLVRQKVYAALGGIDRESSNQRLWWTAAREFFNKWVNSGANANLQFVPYSEAQADDDDGTGLVDAACKVYIFYTKKIATATANVVKLFDSATVDTTSTEQTLSILLDAADQESMQIYPTGFSHAAGVTITQHTTVEGAADGSDGGNGFIVIGAA